MQTASSWGTAAPAETAGAFGLPPAGGAGLGAGAVTPALHSASPIPPASRNVFHFAHGEIAFPKACTASSPAPRRAIPSGASHWIVSAIRPWPDCVLAQARPEARGQGRSGEAGAERAP